MLKCPYCGFENEFKLIKTWKYSWWDVYFYECSRCGNKFRYQVDPEGKKESFMIKIGARRGRKK
jgi:DNA-directed RNA polymerase subunit RPC12/RpoP